MTFRYLLLSLSVLMATALMGGCNTIEGAGQDVERAGEEIEDAAD